MRYGLTTNLASKNPLVIAFHEWIAIARDVARASSPREALGYVFGPPGWHPEDSLSETSARRRAEIQRPPCT